MHQSTTILQFMVKWFTVGDQYVYYITLTIVRLKIEVYKMEIFLLACYAEATAFSQENVFILF